MCGYIHCSGVQVEKWKTKIHSHYNSNKSWLVRLMGIRSSLLKTKFFRSAKYMALDHKIVVLECIKQLPHLCDLEECD